MTILLDGVEPERTIPGLPRRSKKFGEFIVNNLKGIKFNRDLGNNIQWLEVRAKELNGLLRREMNWLSNRTRGNKFNRYVEAFFTISDRVSGNISETFEGLEKRAKRYKELEILGVDEEGLDEQQQFDMDWLTKRIPTEGRELERFKKHYWRIVKSYHPDSEDLFPKTEYDCITLSPYQF